MKNIKFSVLMSIYNKENPQYFSDSMNSILNQNLLPDEIVLVEDGELPETLEKVVIDYEKKCSFLKVLRFKENRGLGPALNDGIKKCKYDYVARVDTDDICHSDRFAIQINYLKQNPNIDVIGSNMIEYDEKMNHILSLKTVPESGAEIEKYIKKRNPMNHPTVIFKKKKVLEVNGYENYPYFEDYYLWAKLIKNSCVFYNIQENLYDFRAGISMIKRRGGKKYLSCIKKFEKGLLELGIINKYEYIENVFARYLISLIPNSLRLFIYNKLLRKKIIER